jgi:YVTN family beta-propeller protein
VTGLINRDAAVYSRSTGKIYLVDPAHGSVIAISSPEHTFTIKVGGEPIAIAINQKTDRIYVVNAEDRSVAIVDAHTDTVIATVPTAARPYAIAVDEASNKVFVSNTFSNMLTVVDGASNSASNLRTGSADAILVDPERQKVYLLGYETDSITELEPTTGAMRKLAAGDMHLWGMVRSGGLLYVSHVQGSSIAAIDPLNDKTQNLPTGAMPCAIAVNSKTGDIYVANYADGTVTILSKKRKSSSVRVSAQPQALALDEAAGLLYVASPQQNTVTVIDTRTAQTLRTFRDVDHPYAVTFSPVTHQAYAINEGESPFTPFKPR